VETLVFLLCHTLPVIFLMLSFFIAAPVIVPNSQLSSSPQEIKRVAYSIFILEREKGLHWKGTAGLLSDLPGKYALDGVVFNFSTS
jgi:hypothetical protein